MITIDKLPDGRFEVKGPGRSYGKFRTFMAAVWRRRVVRISQRKKDSPLVERV
jgi:hypothetical protein